MSRKCCGFVCPNPKGTADLSFCCQVFSMRCDTSPILNTETHWLKSKPARPAVCPRWDKNLVIIQCVMNVAGGTSNVRRLSVAGAVEVQRRAREGGPGK